MGGDHPGVAGSTQEQQRRRASRALIISPIYAEIVQNIKPENLAEPDTPRGSESGGHGYCSIRETSEHTISTHSNNKSAQGNEALLVDAVLHYLFTTAFLVTASASSKKWLYRESMKCLKCCMVAVQSTHDHQVVIQMIIKALKCKTLSA